MKFLYFIIFLNLFIYCYGYYYLDEVLSWKQITYELDDFLYKKDADYKKTFDGVHFEQELEDWEKFFIQYNNIPIGFEVYKDLVFVTVPRRRYGIPSTLNYVELSHNKSPHLKRYPGSENVTSVYRPRIDVCGRLWMVDTGLLEVPGNRTQVKQPAIVIYDLHSHKQILYYELKASDLINERTPGGLTSIAVDVTEHNCDDAYAYINDLATEGMIVFSLRRKESFRINHSTFVHDESSLNFTVADYTIPWKDGLFSIALSEPNYSGDRTLYYHPLASIQEFSVNTKYLKSGTINIDQFKTLGIKGRNTQSGSHDYHPGSRTLFFGNVAQDAILCWRVDDKMAPENVEIALQDHEKLVYISDLKVIGDYIWVLVNKMPIFVYSKFNLNENNFFIHRISINKLLKTSCRRKQ
uniref:Yellow-f4 n=1 Tax=Heliconius melpomene TaxID=34740 RepID=F1AAN7_HELME|nr:yellow-f4 [Heliconius melpomene]